MRYVSLAVRQLNDVVWNLDAQNDSVPNRLRDYAHHVLVPSGRDVRFVGSEATGAAPDLSAPVRRHLYLMNIRSKAELSARQRPATARTTLLPSAVAARGRRVVSTGQRPAPASQLRTRGDCPP